MNALPAILIPGRIDRSVPGVLPAPLLHQVFRYSEFYYIATVQAAYSLMELHLQSAI
jgi:hypothetical protein